MIYKSTRNSSINYSASRAIAQGISEEGGLFVPTEFPSITGDLSSMIELNYIERAKIVLSKFLTDFTAEEIDECASSAYAYEKFDGDTPAKLCVIENGFSVLELWHGPTCAFKDMALQILPHLLTKSLKKAEDKKTAVILVATSGDTGKAALEGFKDVDGTKIMVFYPENGVSAMQLRQMNTQEGENLTVCAVKGNFDDCQTQVKKIFTDEKIKQMLSENNLVFSSANSINWGRLLPQIIYYISSYLDLYKAGRIKKLDEKVNFVVPTGNFGNILAAFYAKQMGLPIGKLICASNANNVLTDFINTGTYDKERSFFTTNSPSMDILVSSNLERLLYHLCGDDSKKLSEWMNALNSNGSYTVDAETADKVKDLFYGACCDDDETAEAIEKLFTEHKYLCDTHTAVAVKVYNDYVKETGDKTETVIVSTASPYKFAPAVLGSFQKEIPEDEFETLKVLEYLSSLKIPEQIKELKNKECRFNNKADKDTIVDFVTKNI
ncbi:MAG: threonine synthase [Clostridia bacterium]